MVTAPAPAAPDPHAPTPPASITLLNSNAAQGNPAAPSSFQSVYQSLPGEPGGASITQLLNLKPAAGKTNRGNGTADNLPTTAALTLAADLPPQRPWAPAPVTVSLTAQAPTAEPQMDLASALDFANSASNADAKQLSGAAGQDVLQQISAAGSDGITGRRASGQGPVSLTDRQHLPAQPRGSQLPTITSMFTAPLQHLAELPVSPAGVTPDLQQSGDNAGGDSLAASLRQHGAAPVAVNKQLALSLAPRTENLAFALRMKETDSSTHATPGLPQPARNQAGGDLKTEAKLPTLPTAAAAARAALSANVPDGFSSANANLIWSEVSALPHQDLHTGPSVSESLDPAQPSLVAALHDIQPILPEAPRANTAGEILLQLGNQNQSAAIRVTDHAGAVNVSVHAADPDLRTSLRSNLGDLANQLATQGWKAEVAKTGTTLTRAETPQDPQPDGQRSPSHQQSPGSGDRQPQRDRRANGGQWLADLEEYESGNSGNRGGRN